MRRKPNVQPALQPFWQLARWLGLDRHLHLFWNHFFCTSLKTSSLELLKCAIPRCTEPDQDDYGRVGGSKSDGGRHK